MKKNTVFHWIAVSILVLSLGLAACSNTGNEANAVAGAETQSEIDVDELLKDTENGVVVTRVNSDSPAEEIGLQKGDVILMIGDREVDDVDALREALEAYEEGDRVQVVIRRGNEIIMKTAQLGAGPDRGYLGASVCCGGTMLTVREGGLFGGSAQVVVLDVVPDSPAEKAGLEIGDYIVSIDDSEIEYDMDLRDVIQAYQPGDTLTLAISREGEEKEVTVKLGENPDSAGAAYLGVQYQMIPAMRFIGQGDLPGFRFGLHTVRGKRLWGIVPVFGFPLDEDSGKHFTFTGSIRGIFIASVEEDSPAEEAGLQVHDVITKLDSEEVEDIDEFIQTIVAHKPGDEITLTINRSEEDEELDITITLGEHPEKAGMGYLGVTLGGMIVTEVVNKDGEEDEMHHVPLHFYFEDFHHFEYPFGEDV